MTSLTRTLQLCCLSVLLSPIIAMANDATAPPLGLLRHSSSADRTMTACKGGNSKMLFEDMAVVVAGRYRCTPAYGKAKDYLVVYFGKQRFFVEYDAVFMLDEKRAPLPELDDQTLARLDVAALEKAGEHYRDVAIYSAVQAYNAPAKHGVSVLDFSVYDESKYTEATGFKLEVYNPTQKTIKYIRVELMGMNAVDDPVRDRFGGSAIKQVRGIGPIEPQDFGSYTFEHLWFTDTVEWAKLVSLRVDYMDGSSKTIKNLKRVKVDQVHQDALAWDPE